MRMRDGQIPGALQTVRRRLRLACGVRGVCLALLALGLAVILSLGLDRLFRLGVPSRMSLLAVFAVALLEVLRRYLLRPLRQDLDERTLADIVEYRRPELRDLVRSAVDFSRDATVTSGESRRLETALKRLVVRKAEEESARIRSLGVVDAASVGRASGAGLVALALVALVFGFSPTGTLETWFRRNILLSASVEWPYRTRLVVQGLEDGRIGVARGDPVTIGVRVEGEVPDRAWMEIEYAAERRRFPLSYLGDRLFRYTHPEVREAFVFHVAGGDYRSGALRVEVLERPRLETFALRKVFPEYMEVAPEILREASGDLSIPVGTRLQISATSTKDLRRAWLVYNGVEEELSVDPRSPRRLACDLGPERDGLLTVRYVDTEGVVPESPTRIAIRLLPDREPSVKLRASGIGSLVSARARIPLDLEATDDYRVDRLKLVHDARAEREVRRADEMAPGRAPGKESAAAPAAIAGTTELEGFEPAPIVVRQHVFEVADHAIEPESRLTLVAEGVDSDTLRGPKTGRSAAMEFRVVTDQKLMDDFLRRQEEQHQAFKRLVAVERTLRDELYEAMDSGLKRPGALTMEVADAFLEHTRQERSMATQILGIRSTLAAILEEMANNRVGEAGQLERLGEKVIGPLRELAVDELPQLAGGFAEIRSEKRAADRLARAMDLAEAIEDTLQRMEDILTNMMKLEGFTEIVNQLRAIIEIQGESREAAAEARRRLLEKVFEDEDLFEDNEENGEPGDPPGNPSPGDPSQER